MGAMDAASQLLMLSLPALQGRINVSKLVQLAAAGAPPLAPSPPPSPPSSPLPPSPASAPPPPPPPACDAVMYGLCWVPVRNFDCPATCSAARTAALEAGTPGRSQCGHVGSGNFFYPGKCTS
jgi:hypothetical protein